MRELSTEEAQLEGLFCLLCWQYLDVAVVDELQHGTEETAHLCLVCLLSNSLKAHCLCLPQHLTYMLQVVCLTVYR